MPTLIFRGADGKEQRKDLAGELAVGRDASNDVVLTDQGVSRRHCRFYADDQGTIWVEDLGSANGVLVDGQRIGEATEVPEGVEVVVGGCKVRLASGRASSQRPAAGSGGRPARPSARDGAIARSEGGGKRATRMMATSEASPRARPKPRASLVARDDGRPVLRGMAGPFAGQTFGLDKPKVMVGRVPPADILLDDDSVSRRHAEIVKIGPRFSVRDLGSANGTFLNGDRVSEAPLQPSDVVRFGVVELSFSGPVGAKGKGLEAGRKKLFLIGGGAAALLLLLAVLAAVGGGGKKKERITDVPVVAAPENPSRLMGQCMSLTDPESDELNWAKGVEVCGRAHELDPTLGAGKRLKLAKREMDAEKKLDDAKLLVSTTQEEGALKKLVEIDKESSVFPRAKQKFDEATSILLKRNRAECKSFVSSGMFEAGLPYCVRALELTCNRQEGVDPEAQSLNNNALRNMGRKSDFRCPPEYAKFQRTVTITTTSTVEAESAIRSRYENPKVAKVMLGYFNIGRAKQASDELKRMRSQAPPKERDAFNELVRNLDIIEGRWATAQGYLQINKVAEAHEVSKDAFVADAQLLPSGLQSSLVKEIRIQLARKYHEQARDELQKEHFDLAFESVYAGYQLDPHNTELAQYVGKMEREAARV
ncbi:MAG: FHA domain-containing protein, partial [Deltaproteobacteria bacterium]|nr:FHA domain-containing protein [Deltaproteobacteria bacterium]